MAEKTTILTIGISSPTNIHTDTPFWKSSMLPSISLHSHNWYPKYESIYCVIHFLSSAMYYYGMGKPAVGEKNALIFNSWCYWEYLRRDRHRVGQGKAERMITATLSILSMYKLFIKYIKISNINELASHEICYCRKCPTLSSCFANFIVFSGMGHWGATMPWIDPNILPFSL